MRAPAREPVRELARGYVPVAAAVAVWYGLRAVVFASPWAGFDRVTTFLNVGPLRELTLRLELLGGSMLRRAWLVALLFVPLTIGAGWIASQTLGVNTDTSSMVSSTAACANPGGLASAQMMTLELIVRNFDRMRSLCQRAIIIRPESIVPA